MLNHPRASIVIPAHNEAAVMARCLDALHRDAEPGEWEVVVAANACSDTTVAIARAHPATTVCLDLAAAGKIGALNSGDAAAGSFPRIYLDADIEVSSAALRTVVDALAEPGVHVAAPSARWLTQGCTWGVRSYYRTWTRLPVMQEASVGSGIFALDEAGHARVAPFPDVIADDEYVRRAFAAHERRCTDGTFDVHVARTLRALVTRAARVRMGNVLLRRHDDSLATPTDGSSARFVLGRLRHPAEIPHVVVFLGVTLAVRVVCSVKLRRNDTRWSRDESTRQPSTLAPPPTPGGDR